MHKILDITRFKRCLLMLGQQGGNNPAMFIPFKSMATIALPAKCNALVG
jgi:hypothetical protein